MTNPNPTLKNKQSFHSFVKKRKHSTNENIKVEKKFKMEK
jgi:hypothetical protein